MEERVQELELAAQQVATCELLCRVTEGQERQKHLQQLRDLRNRANQLRASDPDCAQKQFWWDVDFGEGAPMETDETAYHMANGFYIETGELDPYYENGRNYLRTKPKSNSVKGMLEYYSTFKDAFLLLYMDKKKMRKMVKIPVQIKTIYHVENRVTSHKQLSYVNSDMSYVNYLLYSYQQDVNRIQAQMNEDLARSDSRFDRMETFCNAMTRNAAMTNEEAYMNGRMSIQDYFNDSAMRDLNQSTIYSKAREQQEARRYQLERMLEEYRRNVKKSEHEVVTGDQKLCVMEVGKAAYCGNELVALIIDKGDAPVYEFHCAADFDLLELSGKYYGWQKLFERPVAKIPLFQYLLQAHGNELPLHQVLNPRPLNCPDAEWRMWSEIRWAHTLGLMQSVK